MQSYANKMYPSSYRSELGTGYRSGSFPTIICIRPEPEPVPVPAPSPPPSQSLLPPSRYSYHHIITISRAYSKVNGIKYIRVPNEENNTWTDVKREELLP